MKKQLSILLIAVVLLCASIPCFADITSVGNGAGLHCDEPFPIEKR